MKHSAYIYNELNKISPFLAELEKTNIFSIPANYFENLDAQIFKRINDDPFQVMPASELPGLSVPAGYFENLAENILQKIKSLDTDNAGDEIRRLSPALSAAKNVNVFTVPVGYFEALPGTITGIVKPPAKVIVMKKRSMVWNCAAAAMLTGVMAISALWVSDSSSTQTPATADNKTIPVTIKDALQYKNEQQIDEGIADLSDADIIKYLETTGSNADDEALASGIQENELPDEKDYLTNGNTLEDFLRDTKSKTNQN